MNIHLNSYPWVSPYEIELTVVPLADAWTKAEDGRYWGYTHKTQIAHEGGLTACWCGRKGYWPVVLIFSMGGGRRGEGNGCLIIGRLAGVPHEGEGTMAIHKACWRWWSPFVRGRGQCPFASGCWWRLLMSRCRRQLLMLTTHAENFFLNTCYFLSNITTSSHVSYNWALLVPLPHLLLLYYVPLSRIVFAKHFLLEDGHVLN